MARNPIVFQNGTLVSSAKVEVGGTVYDVTPAQYEGTTPLSANNLNQMQTNIYDYVDEEIEGITEVYSTAETLTNKIWINGKPIYKKVLEPPMISTSASQLVSFSGLNIDSVFLDEVHSFFTLTNNVKMPLNYYASTTDWCRCYLKSDGAYLNFGNVVSSNVATVTLTIEYTKTTD